MPSWTTPSSARECGYAPLSLEEGFARTFGKRDGLGHLHRHRQDAACAARCGGVERRRMDPAHVVGEQRPRACTPVPLPLPPKSHS
jgi:hypothetical protein